MSSPSQSGVKSIFMKYATLILITLQTTILVLMLRFSRKNSSQNERYYNSTAVFMSELSKFCICIFVIVYNGSPSDLLNIFREEILGKPRELFKTVIPAFLYTIQNNLLFLALTNLDAATYQVTYQFKIITTALFSIWILKKDLSLRQWCSLFILMTGVILVQMPNETPVISNNQENRLIGLLAIILSSFSSGFSGVYFEKLIKYSKMQSLWLRNLQLAMLSCLFASFTVVVNDYQPISNNGFFFGYNLLTWIVICLQAFGGICVSLVMKYADNILKGDVLSFKMNGYYLSDVIELLNQQNEPKIVSLCEFCTGKTFWTKNDRQEILDLISTCLIQPECCQTIAELFSPILLDLFIRAQKNHPKSKLFITLAKLIGCFVCATNFAYDSFLDGRFEAKLLIEEVRHQEKEIVDFLECCFVYTTFDKEFFLTHFDWSFLAQFFDHSNRYCRYLSKKIYANLFQFDSSTIKKFIHQRESEDFDDSEFRLRLFHLNNERHLKFIPKTIEYRQAKTETLLICDEDFSPEVVSIRGILLPVKSLSLSGCHLEDYCYENNENFERNLKQISLGVSLSRPILVDGPMSSGKSTLINHLARLTGRHGPPDIITIQISDQVDAKYLLGSYVCSDIPGEFIYNYGPLLRAIRDGLWIILEDIDMASSELISSIFSIIQSKNTAHIAGCDGKIDKFNSNFRIFFTRSCHNSSSIVLNFNMLESICYTVSLEPLNSMEIGKLLNVKWPHLNVMMSRIISIYEELTKLYKESKIPTKRTIWLRDLIKWCNRLSGYFHLKSGDQQTSKFAFLDSIDCFVGFLETNSKLSENISLMIGSNFNLTKLECEHLLKERCPTVEKVSPEKIRIGRQTVLVSKLSKHLSDFAFTLSTTQLLERLLVCVQHHEPVLLCGETGVGKTSCIQYLANICGRRLNIVNMNQQSNSQELFGGYKPIDWKYLFQIVHDEYDRLFLETFSSEKNETFRKKFQILFQRQDYQSLVEVMLHICQKSFQKLDQKSTSTLLDRWTMLQRKLSKFKMLIEGNKQLTFTFIEGVLTHAIKTGEWILLDEINLAENETLQSLLSFMENGQMLMLSEKAQDQFIRVHPDFRLFACMNPATDIGKKELPLKIRSRFTEFFIDEPSDDRSQLRTIVCTYVENLLDKRIIESVVDFYQQIKHDSKSLLKDINGHRPVFSLRNLCRALRVIKINPFMSIQRSIYEAFSLAFLSNLDQSSYELVQKRIENILFHNQKLSTILNVKLDEMKQFPSEKFVIIENYPIVKGSEITVIDETYILTNVVRKNLRDICRIISAGQTYPILLQGETSVGKTSLIQWLAKATGNVCHRVNNHEHTDLQEYVGLYCSEPNGQILFKKGILVHAMKHGHWIILDELNLAPTEVLEALNRVLDDNREIFLPETQEIIRAHPRFLLFATQNPPGRYGGRKILSRAFRNRFIELNFNEIPLDELEIILHRKCSIPISYSKRMVAVLTELQKCRCRTDIFAGKHGFITLRDLFRWGYRYMKFAQKLNPDITFYDWNQFLANQGYMLLAGRVRNRDDARLIKDILEKKFKCKISLEELFYSYNPLKFKDHSFEINQHKIVWTNAYKRLGRLVQEAIDYEEPILLVGETGCGKTTICQYFARVQQKDLKIINCHMNTESGDFLGSLRPNRNASKEYNSDDNQALFEWIDGPLVTAMKNGDYFLVDEISLADDSVLERLNSVLELERTIFLAEQQQSEAFLIKANQTFRYFATMNPGGDYGKKELSPALRDRFTEIWCPVFEEDDDVGQIVINNLNIRYFKDNVAEMICKFVKWFEEYWKKSIRNHFHLSIRDLLSWTDFINRTTTNGQLNIREAFIHGAYLVFIDSLNSNNKSRSDNSIDKMIIECQTYIEMLSQQIPLNNELIIGESLEPKFFTIGPFSVEKGQMNDNSSGYLFYWQSSGIQTNAIRVMRAMQLDKPILLEGPPGVGKTSLIQALAIQSGHNLIRINLSEQTDIGDLFGCDVPMQGENNVGRFTFREGPFLTALKSDSTWILLDELNLASQTVLEGLNACLDHRGEIYISELNKTFKVDKLQTRIFASQNPYTMDGTRKGLPKSFLNRFTLVYIDDLKDDDFLFILENLFPKVQKEFIQKMVNVNRKIQQKVQNDTSFCRKGGPFEFNLRDLIRWTELIDKWNKNHQHSKMNPSMFFDMIYTGKMRTDEDKKKMRSICFDVFPESLPDDGIVSFMANSLWQFGYAMIRFNNNKSSQTLNYLFDGHKRIIQSILMCIQMNWLTILVGDSGLGKTHLIRSIANVCGQHLTILNVNAEMDTIDLLGGFDQKDMNIDLKCLEHSVVERCFQWLKSSASNFENIKLTSKFFHFFYLLNNSDHSQQISYEEEILKQNFKAKIRNLRKILNLFTISENFLSDLSETLKNFEMMIDNDMFGQQTGTFEWRDSTLIQSIQQGHWVLIENANFLNPAVLDRLNSLLEPGGCLTIQEKGSIDGQIIEIYPHQNFRLFLTMNSKYGELSRAMRNRGIEIALTEPESIVNKMELVEISQKLLKNNFMDGREFNDLNSYFKLIFDMILHNQHGEHFANYSESIGKFESKLSIINLNQMCLDPNLYRALQDYLFGLKLTSLDENSLTKIRLFLENSSLNDLKIRLEILKNREFNNKFIEDVSHKMFIVQKNLQQFISKNSVDSIMNTFPMDFRENPYLWNFAQNSSIGDILNRNFNHVHLNLFWLELKHRFKMCTMNQYHGKGLHGAIKEFVQFALDEINQELLIKNTITDEEVIDQRFRLIFLYQLFSIGAKCSTTTSGQQLLIQEEFWPFWFLFQNNQINGKFSDKIQTSMARINENFQFVTWRKFDEEKSIFIQNVTENYFHLKTKEDFELFEKFREFLKLVSMEINGQNDHLLSDYLNELTRKMIKTLDDYFHRRLNYENVDQQLSNMKDFVLKEKLQSQNDNTTGKIVQQQEFQSSFMLKKLFSILNIFDKWGCSQMAFLKLNSTVIRNVDPYTIFFEYFLFDNARNNQTFTDLLVEILFYFNEQFTVDRVRKSVANFQDDSMLSSKFLENFNPQLLNNVTMECSPLISLVYYKLFQNHDDTIELFHHKQLTRNVYREHLLKNYSTLKMNSTSELLMRRFQMIANLFHRRSSDNSYDKINDFINSVKMQKDECFELIVIGYAIAICTLPDYPIDPVVRTKAMLMNYHCQAQMTSDELKLRHEMYMQTYGHHDPEFNCPMFKMLIKELNRFEQNFQQLGKCIQYRQMVWKYFKMINEIQRFQTTIFNWESLSKIIKEVVEVLNDDYGHQKQQERKRLVSHLLNLVQTLNDFLKNLHELYVDYQDLTTCYKVGLLLTLKGLQMLIYRLQSEINWHDLLFDHGVNQTKTQDLFKIFTRFLTDLTPSDICKQISQHQFFSVLSKIYQKLNLNEKTMSMNLLESMFLDIKNSICLGDHGQEILHVYFQTIDSFVEQWKQNEQQQESDELRRNALFHIKLQDDHKDELYGDDLKRAEEFEVEQMFPTFKDYYHGLREDFEIEHDKHKGNKTINQMNNSQDCLLFIARSHMNIISLLNCEHLNNIQTIRKDFIKSYLIRYRIIADIFHETLGFFPGADSIELNLLDGHLLESCPDEYELPEMNLMNIYQSSIESQTRRCCNVLEELRLKIVEKLLPEFENHPTLLNLLKIIHRIYSLKVNSSLICFATGLELILKTSEDWQLIAHRGISLVEHLDKITELLVEWRKMEINYWLNCLSTVVNKKLEDKEIVIWWPRFYTAINDLIQNGQRQSSKCFIENVKKFMETSTLGQFQIRLNIINVFVHYLTFYQKKNKEQDVFLEQICIPLKNVYNFYQHFLSNISKTIQIERESIEKEIRKFVQINKWNPNNFWSLKTSLARAKKQLFGYVKKYEETLKRPASTAFQFDHSAQQEIVEESILKLNPDINFNSKSFKLSKNFGECFHLLSNAETYLNSSRKIFMKIQNSYRKSFVKQINCLDDLNREFINGIQEYSKLGSDLGKFSNDPNGKKKFVANIRSQKRRALSDMFKKLSQLGLRFRKGLVYWQEDFNFNDTMFRIRPLELTLDDDNNDDYCRENVEKCNLYYYKCLSGYTRFRQCLEKPNDQLTKDMIDRIKGNIVHLSKIVIKQRELISKHLFDYNRLREKFWQIQMGNFGENDRTLRSYDLVNVLLSEFNELLLKFLSFSIRLRELIRSLNGDGNNLDKIIDSIRKITKNNDFKQLNKMLFYTESSIETFKMFIEKFKIQQISLLTLDIDLPDMMKQMHSKLIYIENQIEILQKSNDQISTTKNSQNGNKCNFLLKNIMFCFELIFKNLPEIPEDKDNLIKKSCIAEILQLFKASRIELLIKDFIDHVNSSDNDSSIEMLKILSGFYGKYMILFRYSLNIACGSLKTDSKLLHILLSLSNELLANGFCLPPDFENDDKDSGTDKNSSNNQDKKAIEDRTGFGEGDLATDATDVSDRLECQDQLDDLDNGQDLNADKQKQNQQKDEKNGIEMDDDFEGQEYGAETTELDEDQENESDQNDENLSNQMGNVDDDEQVLDEKLWNNDEDYDDQHENKDNDENSLNKDSNLTGGQEDFDTKMVANQENDQLRKNDNQKQLDDDDNEYMEQPNNIEDDNDECRDRDQTELNKINDNVNGDDPGEQEENITEMVLPEQMEIEDNVDDGEYQKNVDNDEQMNQEDDKNDDGDENFDQGDIGQNEINKNSDEFVENDEQEGNAVDNFKSKNHSENNALEPQDMIYANLDNGAYNQEFQFTEQDKPSESSNGTNNKQITTSNNDQTSSQSFRKTNKPEPLQENSIQQEYSMSKRNMDRSMVDDEELLQNVKRQKITNEQSETNKEIDEDNQDQEFFRHVPKKEMADQIACDLVLKNLRGKILDDQFERDVNINDYDDGEDQKEDQMNYQDYNVSNKKKKDPIDDKNKKEEKINNKKPDIMKGDFVETSNVKNIESTFHLKNVFDDFNLDSGDSNNFIEPLNDSMLIGSMDSVQREFLIECEKKIEPLLYELCNQLQLVLEPTKRSKYKGDFKNGKRLNMRKVIAYVASQFRKDKIWLRRTKPCKRQYQIIIAVDDSLSMSDNQSRMIAFESLILLGRSLSIIESGLLSVISFGEQVRVLHSFGDPFTDQTALKMFQKFKFNQKMTKINELLKYSLSMFASSKQQIIGSSSNVHQLLLIVSDGRGVFSEGNQNIQSQIIRLKEMDIFSVFIIIDNPEHKTSILDIRIPVFTTDGKMQIHSYIERFPFPFYVILKEIESLPTVLGEALRQWFELFAYDNK